MAGFGSSSGMGGGDDDVISGINVTPLVDVVLVLLVIFLITAPVIYQSAIKVQLPKASSGEQAQASPLDFVINRQGEVHWGKSKIDWTTLNARLSEAMKKNPDQTAIISADQATPHGSVIKLMDALRRAGLVKFALNVEAAAPR